MYRQSIPFLSFGTLFILTIIFYCEIVTSPYNTATSTLFALSAFSIFKLSVSLLLVTIGYWILLRKKITINLILCSIHLISTIPLLLFIKQPSLFIHTTNTESEIVSGFTVSSGVDLSLYKANIAIYMFVTAQILFVAYFTDINCEK